MPADKLLDPAALRWTLCATDRCFKRSLLVPFFRAAKVRLRAAARHVPCLRMYDSAVSPSVPSCCWGRVVARFRRACKPHRAKPACRCVPQVLPVERGAGLSQFGMQLAQVGTALAAIMLRCAVL